MGSHRSSVHPNSEESIRDPAPEERAGAQIRA